MTCRSKWILEMWSWHPGFLTAGPRAWNTGNWFLALVFWGRTTQPAGAVKHPTHGHGKWQMSTFQFIQRGLPGDTYSGSTEGSQSGPRVWSQLYMASLFLILFLCLETPRGSHSWIANKLLTFQGFCKVPPEDVTKEMNRDGEGLQT